VPYKRQRFQDPDEILRAIAENRRVREDTQSELDAEREVMRALLIRGRHVGVTVSAMSGAAGISRETAHKLLREAGESPKKKGKNNG
jgi:hypothetical protein